MKLEDLPVEIPRRSLEEMGAEKMDKVNGYLKLKIEGWSAIYEPKNKGGHIYVLRNSIPEKNETLSKTPSE